MNGVDSEYQLCADREPDVAAIANVLAHQEGHGPGYILWEFPRDVSFGAPVLGFRGQGQHPHAWLKSIVVRFGLLAGVSTTGGKRGAAKRLTAELAEGGIR
jgi:hypothetical protein